MEMKPTKSHMQIEQEHTHYKLVYIAALKNFKRQKVGFILRNKTCSIYKFLLAGYHIFEVYIQQLSAHENPKIKFALVFLYPKLNGHSNV